MNLEGYSRDQLRVAYERTMRFYKEKGHEWPFTGYLDFIENIKKSLILKPSVLMETFEIFIKEIKPYIPNPEKEVWHPLDIEYFQQFPAPIMENSHRLHYTNINSTITFFGPMLYYLVRALGCEHILEIGMAEGYTSFYLANAVKDNGTRYRMAKNMYYGVEILNKAMQVKEELDKLHLPNDIRVMDSMELNSDTFKGVTFDLIFQDGSHETENVVHEIDVLYPQLKGEGKGFLICHDVYGPAEEGVHEIIKNSKYNWEHIRICEIYGIAILRKMDGYVEHKHWR